MRGELMNSLGLNQQKTSNINDELNKLLANYQIFYMNVRGFHWNIKGNHFFELHVKFEETYDDLLQKIDEIAERILALNGKPLHAYSQYIQHAEIQEMTDVSDDINTVRSIRDSFITLIKIQRRVLDMSNDAGDEGTGSMISDYIKEQEKLVWMFSAYLD